MGGTPNSKMRLQQSRSGLHKKGDRKRKPGQSGKHVKGDRRGMVYRVTGRPCDVKGRIYCMKLVAKNVLECVGVVHQA